jgi:hypothetical protein
MISHTLYGKTGGKLEAKGETHIMGRSRGPHFDLAIPEIPYSKFLWLLYFWQSLFSAGFQPEPIQKL